MFFKRPLQVTDLVLIKVIVTEKDVVARE